MVFLKYCLLPVTPSKITTKINNANRAITLIDEGQVNLLKKAELTDVEFECMIPQTNYPFALYKSGFLGASFFLAYFERLKTSKKPFQFIVVRMKPNGRILFSTNLKVTLEDYTIVEDAGQGLDLTVKINLKQWRDYRTKLVNIQENDDSTITATVQTDTAAALSQGVKVFLSPNVSIKAGSKLTVTQNGVTTAYKSSGVPAVYPTHQEIILTLFERWA